MFDVLAALCLERRDEAPAAGPEEDVRREQRVLERVRPRHHGRRLRRVLDPERRLPDAGGFQLERERDVAAERPGREGADADATLDRGVTLRPTGGRRPPPRARARRPPGRGLHLEVVEGGAAPCGVRGRVDDPERGRGRVLRRAGGVRIERVSLVEEGEETSSSRPTPRALVQQPVDDVVERGQAECRLAPAQPLQRLLVGLSQPVRANRAATARRQTSTRIRYRAVHARARGRSGAGRPRRRRGSCR